MSRKRRVFFSQEFKVAAVERMLAGENVSALAKELDVLRKDLYLWRERHRRGGPSALRPRRPGPRRKSEMEGAATEAPAAMVPSSTPPPAMDTLSAAQARIAALERKVGRQALELDFFQRALRHFKKTRRPDDGLGVTASTRSSER